ncbi:hypothetical protein FHG87_003054 [Trinorchestia longiramus]|nr:hypothetical protein FHG87_003054 [Trinorchestia longiramus]
MKGRNQVSDGTSGRDSVSWRPLGLVEWLVAYDCDVDFDLLSYRSVYGSVAAPPLYAIFKRPARSCQAVISSIQGGGGRAWEQTNSSVSGGTTFTLT